MVQILPGVYTVTLGLILLEWGEKKSTIHPFEHSVDLIIFFSRVEETPRDPKETPQKSPGSASVARSVRFLRGEALT